MALPFLPPEHIESVFHQLDQRARTDRVAAFMGYVWRQWFQSSTFGVRNWNVSMTSVRTNNNLEGWHNRINSRMNSRGPVQFYLLLQELYKEATAIPMQAMLVTEGKLERLHIKKTTRLNGKLFCGSSTITVTLVRQSSSGSVPSCMDQVTCDAELCC